MTLLGIEEESQEAGECMTSCPTKPMDSKTLEAVEQVFDMDSWHPSLQSPGVKARLGSKAASGFAHAAYPGHQSLRLPSL